jgi:hypothetical protein
MGKEHIHLQRSAPTGGSVLLMGVECQNKYQKDRSPEGMFQDRVRRNVGHKIQ